MDANLRREVESLRKLKAKQLKLRYRELFQEDSRSSNQQYLFRRIAWRLHALLATTLDELGDKRAAVERRTAIELLTAVAATLRDRSMRSHFLSQRAAASLLE